MRAPGWAALGGRMVVAAALLVGLTAIAPVVASAATCEGHPQPPSVDDASLSGVAVLSRCDAWAVGTYGRAWAVGYYGNAGEGVIQAGAGLARPGRRVSGLFDHLLIEKWNGTAWKRVAVPNPGRRGADSWLYGVTAASGTSAWAVGSYVKGTVQRTLVEHWNGAGWKRVASTNPGGSPGDDVLAGVAGSSCSDLWAVGYSFTVPNLSIAVRC
jgi:hypothetical protein